MQFHLIGGFLGSGKTTAIIGAARHLISQGKRVGVVTNDQGRYLVDTAFFQAASLPTVEVTGGCFCCNYVDLSAKLNQLTNSAQPDVIFAESVGSCADIVATVVKPFLELGAANHKLDTFTVFTDARLLRRRLLNQPMPFGDDIVYIFDKQIEEANLLILNKADLLDPQQARATVRLAQDRFPATTARLQDSRQPDQIAAWIELLQSGAIAPPRASVDIDYARYGAGEADLAWLDEDVAFDVQPGAGRRVAIEFIRAVSGALAAKAMPIGHVKFMIRGAGPGAGPGADVKVSLPTLAGDAWEQDVPELAGDRVSLIVNARVETAAYQLRDVVSHAIQHAASSTGATPRESNLSVFHPKFPTPTHRLS